MVRPTPRQWPSLQLYTPDITTSLGLTSTICSMEETLGRFCAAVLRNCVISRFLLLYAFMYSYVSMTKILNFNLSNPSVINILSKCCVCSGCWGTEAANTINGTEGSMFEPLLIYNKSKSVTIYNEQLFRFSFIILLQLEIVKWTENTDDWYCYLFNVMLIAVMLLGEGNPLFNYQKVFGAIQ